MCVTVASVMPRLFCGIDALHCTCHVECSPALMCSSAVSKPLPMTHPLTTECCVTCVQVRPNVHAAFHEHVETKLADLAQAEDQEGPVRKRKSDAKIIAAICAELESQCADPDVQRNAADEFQKYQEVCTLKFLTALYRLKAYVNPCDLHF